METSPRLWFRDNTMIVQLSNVKDAIDGTVIDDADVVGEVFDAANTSIVPEFELAPQTGGLYRGEVDETEPIILNKQYTCVITATKGTAQGKWTINFVGAIRR